MHFTSPHLRSSNRKGHSKGKEGRVEGEVHGVPDNSMLPTHLENVPRNVCKKVSGGWSCLYVP